MNRTHELSPYGDVLAARLNANKELFTKKTGTFADQQLHNKLVSIFNETSELYVKINNDQLKAYLETAGSFVITGIQLNNTQKAAAYACANAASALTSFAGGVGNAFKDNAKGLKDFLAHPWDTSVAKVQDVYKVVSSVSKAVIV